MTHITENNLLNDDCVLEIFKYLNVSDLCQTTQVSQQFDRLSQYTFKHKYAHFELRKHFKKMTRHKLRILFNRFIKFAITLDMDADHALGAARKIQNLTIELMKKNLIIEENSLKNLKLKNFFFLGPHDMLDLYPVFDKLDSLQLEYIPLPETIPDFLETFTKIKHIKLVKCTPGHWPPYMCFSQQCHFLPFTSELQTLDLKYNEYLHPLRLLEGIENYFPCLTELTLYSSLYDENVSDKRLFTTNVINIARLPMLLKLDIDLKFFSINPLLQAIKEHASPIQDISVYHSSFNDDTKHHLNGLKNIKKLRLYGSTNITTHDINHMGIYLENLEELTFNFSSNLDMLKNIIKNAPKLIKLRIPIHSNYDITPELYANILATIKRQKKNQKLIVKMYNFDRIHRNEEERAMLRENNKNDFLTIYRMP